MDAILNGYPLSENMEEIHWKTSTVFCIKYCEITHILNKHATYFAKFISGGMFDADRNNGQRPVAPLWSDVVCLLCCEEKLSANVL